MPAVPVHVPVLLEEVLELLAVRPGGRYIDATAGAGGHTAAILSAVGPGGRVLALDRDPEMVEGLRRSFADEVAAGRLIARHANFARIREEATAVGLEAADGILFDLGVCSHHLDASGRGFAYGRTEPLDLRFDPTETATPPAAALLARASAQELTHIFRTYGEERFASRIARTVVARRRTAPVQTSADLRAAVEASLPARVRWRAGRHAARVFQALRIAVNRELEAIHAALPAALELLAPGGRLVVISFHSLEDRIAKNVLREAARAGAVRLLTRKPLRPGQAEISRNPRSASARLRAVERLGRGAS